MLAKSRVSKYNRIIWFVQFYLNGVEASHVTWRSPNLRTDGPHCFWCSEIIFLNIVATCAVAFYFQMMCACATTHPAFTKVW